MRSIQYLAQDISANRLIGVSAGAFDNWYLVLFIPSSLRIINHVSFPGNPSLTEYTRKNAMSARSSPRSVSRSTMLYTLPGFIFRTSTGSGSPSTNFFFVGLRPRLPFLGGTSTFGFSSHTLVSHGMSPQ